MTFNLKNTVLLFVFIFSFSSGFCQNEILTGADQYDEYIPFLKNKTIGIVAHKASRVNNEIHLVDFLVENKIKIKTIFAPEHGYDGRADNGDLLSDSKDQSTGLNIISLHGKIKKPLPEHLQGIDLMVFDLQDVGARFYTFLSTLHYVMQACAEANIPVLLLDRPNPNGHYVDGPVLDMKFKTYVGMHPVPIVHGMTLGEYASMINGENWLGKNLKCNLRIVKIKNYTHKTKYILPVRPSPNLPNNQAISLYPSLCLLEPTTISIGRGTEKQFQIYGHPNFPKSKFKFKPAPNFGSKSPKWNDNICFGVSLEKIEISDQLNLAWLIDAYNKLPKNYIFFKDSFERIAGTDNLRKQIINKVSINQIRKSWEPGLENYKKLRKKYLIYPDYD
ncbi:MAG: hypothetical protein ACI914_001317 [Candidatus Marivariicella framensis]|jgi:uncharacterized protein YbbC (DUF1343 family)|tara:strand:+ start:3508 stop:4677 length:1170 start_codon:yes stop_codon:yes gene_type:complete